MDTDWVIDYTPQGRSERSGVALGNRRVLSDGVGLSMCLEVGVSCHYEGYSH